MERTGMSAGEVVSQLRAGVEEKTGLTISAGIAVDLLRQEQAKWAIRDGVREIRHHALHA
jgi:nucleotidyltransferase/DNA polymerase involved in DNA repair